MPDSPLSAAESTGDASVPPAEPASVQVARLIAGAALLVGVAATAVLATNHFAEIELPGCGQEHGCGAAAASRWGSGAGWPVSFLGLAYFAALGAGWCTPGSEAPASLLYLVRAGVLASLGWTVALVLGGYSCSYCLATHAANLALWLSAEWAKKPGIAGTRPLLAAGLTFGFVSAVLGWGEARRRDVAAAEAESQMQEAVAALSRPRPVLPEPIEPMAAPTESPYRFGPPGAEVKVRIFIDLECGHCSQAIADARALVQKYPGRVSLSLKHYPFCPDCNHLATANRHPNACDAARALEAAGLLQGADGFWRMQQWLAAHDGSFSAGELYAALRGLGFPDGERFFRAMQAPEVSGRILHDPEEIKQIKDPDLPVMFVNDVMLKRKSTTKTLGRVVRAALSNADRTNGQTPH